jgi:uncharacterized protein (DUF433 family)
MEANMSAKTEYPHIVLNDLGVPVIEGTTMKVVELVASRQAYGWSPEEVQVQYPHLTQGRIHAALAYYWDHADALDREVSRQVDEYEAQRQAKAGEPSPLRQRLQSKGLL